MTGRALLLLRHAEAEACRAGERDRDRRLTESGHACAEAVGRLLESSQLVPDIALVSDARRAVETWRLVTGQLRTSPRELIVPELYDALEDDLLERIRRTGDEHGKLLIVGHNPTIEGLARLLARHGNAEAESRLAGGYPPAALAVFDVDGTRWNDFRPGHAKITRFHLPNQN